MRKIVFWIMVLMLVTVPSMAFGQDDELDGEWTIGADMATPRSEISSAVLDGRIYVAGGLGPGNSTFNGYDTFEVYDIENDEWELLSPLPLTLHHSAMTATDDYVYLSGGYEGSSFTPTIRAIWVYDHLEDTWEQLTEMPSARAAHAMVAIDNRLYIIGGVGTDSTALWIYDIDAGEWDLSAEPLPSPREHLAATVHDGKIYVVGGRWQAVGNVGYLQMYDPEMDTWEFLRDMPTPRGGLTASTVGNRIHVTGGEALDGGITFPQHEAYDIESGTWLTLSPLPTARHGLTSIGWEGVFYVIGGAEGAGAQTTSTLTSLVEIYTPSETSNNE